MAENQEKPTSHYLYFRTKMLVNFETFSKFHVFNLVYLSRSKEVYLQLFNTRQFIFPKELQEVYFTN
jgi:hypothetical protein